MWWYRHKLLKHQNKLMARLLIFNQVTSLLNMFARLVSHLIVKPPCKMKFKC